ncbi:hypothetical protein RJT34_31974 [Clitoria ternatea]|uniref:RBR-type E3 ubiquitin transferase n=1 Tax=Clitoria ternatea TaxID=43366 RepID=A0AAN9I3B3_CLITE
MHMGNSLQCPGHKEEKVSREMTTCEICMEPFSDGKVFNNNNLCVHPFCLDCMAKYIEVKVEDNIGNIQCPALGCKQLLDPVFCSSIISKPLFEKWCDALCASTLLEVKHRSYCPYQDCSALVITECEYVEKVKCPNCNRMFCFKCQIPWHAGYRCDESGQLMDTNDILFGQLIETKRWRRCHRCGQCIEHVGGCSLVLCRCGAYCNYASGEPATSFLVCIHHLCTVMNDMIG